MTDDLMTRARQAIEDEEAARLRAKADELATGDERARLQAEAEAKAQHARDIAAQAMNAPAVTLGGVAKRFDAAVSALVALAQAAELRNRTIQQQAALLVAAEVPEAQARGGNSVELGDEVHSTEVATADNGLKSLAGDLLGQSGPLGRLTPVERAQR
jgi:hypothetical protein